MSIYAWFHLATESDIAVQFEDYNDAITFVKTFMVTHVEDYNPISEDLIMSASFTHIIGVGSLVQAMVTNRLAEEKPYYGHIEILSQDKAIETLLWRLEMYNNK